MLQSPFGLMLRALDDLKPDEVYVCTGPSRAYASWGELMNMSARTRGAAGVVIDGWSRDTPGILALGFPCFSRGRYAQDHGRAARWSISAAPSGSAASTSAPVMPSSATWTASS